jgi:hypothetical protein
LPEAKKDLSLQLLDPIVRCIENLAVLEILEVVPPKALDLILGKVEELELRVELEGHCDLCDLVLGEGEELGLWIEEDWDHP